MVPLYAVNRGVGEDGGIDECAVVFLDKLDLFSDVDSWIGCQVCGGREGGREGEGGRKGGREG